MQRAEGYGLLGGRRPGPSAVEQRDLADAMLMQTLDGIAKRYANRQAEPLPARPTRATRKATPRLGAWERRGGSTAHLGGLP